MAKSTDTPKAEKPKPVVLELTLAKPSDNQWPTMQFHDNDHLIDWLTNEDYGQCKNGKVKGKKVIFTETYLDEEGVEKTRDAEFGTLKDI